LDRYSKYHIDVVIFCFNCVSTGYKSNGNNFLKAFNCSTQPVDTSFNSIRYFQDG